MANQTLCVSLSHLVEPLRLFHPTRVDAGINNGIGALTDFFVLLYSAQSKFVGWNKRSGSTMALHTLCKLDCLKQKKNPLQVRDALHSEFDIFRMGA